MDLEINKKENGEFHVCIWEDDTSAELEYVAMNKWCIKTLHYHARTSYHMFEFKSESDFQWFILRWS